MIRGYCIFFQFFVLFGSAWHGTKCGKLRFNSTFPQPQTRVESCPGVDSTSSAPVPPSLFNSSVTLGREFGATRETRCERPACGLASARVPTLLISNYGPHAIAKQFCPHITTADFLIWDHRADMTTSKSSIFGFNRSSSSS